MFLAQYGEGDYCSPQLVRDDLALLLHLFLVLISPDAKRLKKFITVVIRLTELGMKTLSGENLLITSGSVLMKNKGQVFAF